MADWAEHGRLLAGGRWLDYACFGPAPDVAPTIVMLHEGLGCVALWRDWPERLAEATGFGVFAYSRAGYGQSDPADLPRPLDYMTREAVEVLPEVIAAMGLGRYLLLGHSDGGTIAAEYAGRVGDERLLGLVLIAPHFFTEEMGLEEIARAGEVFETTELAAKMGRYHRDAEHTFRGWNDAWLDPGFKSWNVSEVIPRWSVPCLAIQGSADQYGTLMQIREIEWRSQQPVEVLIVEGAQHAPHLEASGQVTDAVAQFCAGFVGAVAG